MLHAALFYVECYRFYVVACLKAVDWLWGVGGWITLGTTFGAVLLTLIFYSSTLFYCVHFFSCLVGRMVNAMHSFFPIRPSAWHCVLCCIVKSVIVMLVCAICVQRFYHENTAVVAIVSSTMFVMLISDVWVPVLFYIIIDLINFYNYKLEVCARSSCVLCIGSAT
jgi:hypothetical protein